MMIRDEIVLIVNFSGIVILEEETCYLYNVQ